MDFDLGSCPVQFVIYITQRITVKGIRKSGLHMVLSECDLTEFDGKGSLYYLLHGRNTQKESKLQSSYSDLHRDQRHKWVKQTLPLSYVIQIGFLAF